MDLGQVREVLLIGCVGIQGHRRGKDDRQSNQASCLQVLHTRQPLLLMYVFSGVYSWPCTQCFLPLLAGSFSRCEARIFARVSSETPVCPLFQGVRPFPASPILARDSGVCTQP